MTWNKVSDPLRFKSDERQLWAAVIMQHIEDATSAVPVGCRTRDAANATRQEARHWLTTPNADFNDACFLAGLSPEWIRNAAIRKIEAFDRGENAVPVAPVKAKKEAKLFTHAGVSLMLHEWADRVGISHDTLHSRINRLGWTFEKAITTPPGNTRRANKGSPFGFGNMGRTLPV